MHAGDARLTDWSAAAVAARREHVQSALEAVGREDGRLDEGGPVDAVLSARSSRGSTSTTGISLPETNPSLYVEEYGNAIFSHLRKARASARTTGCSRSVGPREDAGYARRGAEESHATRPALRAARDRVRATMDGLFKGGLIDERGRPLAQAKGTARRDDGIDALSALKATPTASTTSRRWSRSAPKGKAEPTSTMELTKAEKKLLPGSLFEIPPGYTKVQFDEMMK